MLEADFLVKILANRVERFIDLGVDGQLVDATIDLLQAHLVIRMEDTFKAWCVVLFSMVRDHLPLAQQHIVLD